MTTYEDTWNKALQLSGAYGPFYQTEAVARLRDHVTFPVWNVLLNATAVDPQPFTMDDYLLRSPYAAPAQRQERLNEALEGGFLAAGADGYRITEAGYAALAAFFGSAQGLIAGAPGLEEHEMARLTALLRRLVEATLALDEPREKLGLHSSRWTDPGPDAAGATLVDQYITDLQLFRDDAHNAAWMGLGIDGGSWEALTFVWRGDAGTAEELAEKLPNRGYQPADYAAALAGLADRGWIVEEDGRAVLTESARDLREQAETTTDRLFYGAWPVLSAGELAELDTYLARLVALLEAAAPEPAAEAGS